MKLSVKVDGLLADAEQLLQARGDVLRLRAERRERWGQVIDRWNELANKAALLMSEEDRGRVSQAIEQANELTGPLDEWLDDLAKGRCRLPDLTAETMRGLLLAWLSPSADGGIVCTACGLEYPRHKHPPLSEWKLLPGREWGVGPPPWYDLPEFFAACPHCGGSRYGSGMDWPHLVDGKSYPWMRLDGYAGKPIQDSPEQSESE